MAKHAYLIMAHNEFGVLKTLIQLLDDPRNDIYIHIDKKAISFDRNSFEGLTRHSKLIFIKRQKVSWGAFSLVDCELNLLREALKERHDYYHLLSGVDLPLKSQDEIHKYFHEHAGEEFLSFHQDYPKRGSFYSRLRYYHLFQEWLGHKKTGLLYILNRISLKLQQTLGINRIKGKEFDFKKGSQWFSITHELASFILHNEDAIKETYRYAHCPDEIYLHTLASNSPFKENITNQSLRYIDWKRGRPYTFRSEDFETLVNSDALWARKFSQNIDEKIIEAILEYFKDN